MTTRTRIALTFGVGLYVIAAVCGLLVLATLLPGAWKGLTLPALAVAGWIASDMIGVIWNLEGQYDDGV